jgi:hypothetical protein
MDRYNATDDAKNQKEDDDVLSQSEHDDVLYFVVLFIYISLYNNVVFINELYNISYIVCVNNILCFYLYIIFAKFNFIHIH